MQKVYWLGALALLVLAGFAALQGQNRQTVGLRALAGLSFLTACVLITRSFEMQDAARTNADRIDEGAHEKPEET